MHDDFLHLETRSCEEALVTSLNLNLSPHPPHRPTMEEKKSAYHQCLHHNEEKENSNSKIDPFSFLVQGDVYMTPVFLTTNFVKGRFHYGHGRLGESPYLL